MTNNFVRGNYFYGNEVSDYGKEHGYVDYATLAKSFDAVLNNNIYGYFTIDDWEVENGSFESYEYDGTEYTYDELQDMYDDVQEEMNDIDDDESEEYKELENKLAEIQDAMDDVRYEEVFQWFIISDNGAEILKEWTNELVFYNRELDMYLWGVTHYGTSWTHVLTDIRCNVQDEDNQ